MIGFRPTNFLIINKGNLRVPSSNNDLKKYNNFLFELGYTIDLENNVYVYKNLGAFKNNIDDNFNSIEELITYSKTSKDKIYSNINDFINNGFEFVIGPPLPNYEYKYIGKGLYCTNYLKDMKKNKVYY